MSTDTRSALGIATAALVTASLLECVDSRQPGGKDACMCCRRQRDRAHKALAAMRAAPGLADAAHARDSRVLNTLERCWDMAHEYGSAVFCDEIQAAIDAYQREKAGLR